MEHLPYTCWTSVHVPLDLLGYIKERRKGGGGEEGERTYVCALVMHSWSTEADVTPVSSYHSAPFWVSVSHWASVRRVCQSVSSTTTSPDQDGVGDAHYHPSFNVRLGSELRPSYKDVQPSPQPPSYQVFPTSLTVLGLIPCKMCTLPMFSFVL